MRPPPGSSAYREIAKKLEAAKLPFVVDFNYLEPGIRVRGGWFPVLKMRWVEGLTLNEFFQQELTARDRTYDLRKLPGMWVKLGHMLHKKEVVHADLQHGNVLLVPRERGVLDLRLVDYDGMHTPELADTPSGELGHLNYQHPQRFREKILNGAVDRFSHLVIYSGIRCLAGGQAELWQRFNNDENLIFQESDFLRPAESQAFQTLWRHEDADARTMVGRLILACGRPLADAPLLDELVTDGRVRPLERAEARAVERVLAARGPLETVALPVQASAAAPGSTGVSLVSGLVPFPPPQRASRHASLPPGRSRPAVGPRAGVDRRPGKRDPPQLPSGGGRRCRSRRNWAWVFPTGFPLAPPRPARHRCPDGSGACACPAAPQAHPQCAQADSALAATSRRATDRRSGQGVERCGAT